MQDVARRADVSAMTVSNVVNGRGARVSEGTRLRVLEAIRELGYRLNMSARQLKQGRSGLIGLGVPDLATAYYAELAARLTERFAADGLRLVVEHTQGTVAGELATLADAHLDLYDGYVLALAAGQTADIQQFSTSRPVVLVGERALSATLDHVIMDNVGGSQMACRLLLGAGARRVVLLGGDLSLGESMQGLRTRGYLAALETADVALDETLVLACEPDTAASHAALSAALDQGLTFDAVFAVTDAGAIGALRALWERGLHVPSDVQVVGFDNLALDAHLVPSLTSVEPDHDAMADAICSLLRSRLEQTADLPPGRLLMPTARVVERESTRPLG